MMSPIDSMIVGTLSVARMTIMKSPSATVRLMIVTLSVA
jgi:hypothetical protein